MVRKKNHKGVIIGWLIICLWSTSLVFLLDYPVRFANPLVYLLILFQTHLYTGLFITGHDAMHHAVSPNKKLNKLTGIVAIGLFAFNSYWTLYPKHHDHHRFVATEKDPDYHQGSFIRWYYSFLKQYVTIWQILLMALTYNILIIFFPVVNVWLYWIVPALLSTLQLFYFGTFLPHKGKHDVANIHRSGSQKKNHFFAFISCYFFGYHYEHHSSPGIPWWQLYKEKK